MSYLTISIQFERSGAYKILEGDRFSETDFAELPLSVKEFIAQEIASRASNMGTFTLWEVKVETPFFSSNYNLYGSQLVQAFLKQTPEIDGEVPHAGTIIWDRDDRQHKLEDLDLYFKGTLGTVVHTLIVYAKDAIEAGNIALQQMANSGICRVIAVNPKGR